MPFGQPAARALDCWLAQGRPRAARRGRRRGAVPRRPRPADRPAGGPHARAPADRRGARRARHRAARAAAHRGHPPARGRRRPALGPGAARARLAGHHAALHPRHHRPAPPRLPAGAPAGASAATQRRQVERAARRRAATRRYGDPRRQYGGARRRRGAAGDGLVAPQRQQPHRPGPDQAAAGRGRSRPRSQPQCRQARGKQCDAGERPGARSRAPAATASPTVDRGADRLVGRAGRRRGRPPRRRGRRSCPANETVPGSAARTGWPGEPSRSTPRCPAPQGDVRRVEAAHHLGHRLAAATRPTGSGSPRAAAGAREGHDGPGRRRARAQDQAGRAAGTRVRRRGMREHAGRRRRRGRPDASVRLGTTRRRSAACGRSAGPDGRLRLAGDARGRLS